jgi:hypothetical protein
VKIWQQCSIRPSSGIAQSVKWLEYLGFILALTALSSPVWLRALRVFCQISAGVDIDCSAPSGTVVKNTLSCISRGEYHHHHSLSCPTGWSCLRYRSYYSYRYAVSRDDYWTLTCQVHEFSSFDFSSFRKGNPQCSVRAEQSVCVHKTTQIYTRYWYRRKLWHISQGCILHLSSLI